ncbi:hypothetical protein MN116_001139 [Schistosoma mekongi]|uniref:4Fe-4S ferredoxin-type domain-containing protein n=1 Tax=Schistosoma mekongi TaxID=38744 RepID=A0AAE1ZLZ2_SCHME|nr:hypothetical protein MN116_001139 [Schistosoma mekongi]
MKILYLLECYDLTFFGTPKTVGSLLCAIITNFITTSNTYLVQFTGCGCVCVLALIASIWIEDRKIPKVCKICNCCVAKCPSLRVGYHGNEIAERILNDDTEQK